MVIELFESFWLNYIENVPFLVCYGVYPVLVQIVSFWLFNSPFILYQFVKSGRKKDNSSSNPGLLDKYVGFLDQFLINPKHSPLDSELYNKIMRTVLKMHLLVGLPVNLIISSFLPPPNSRKLSDLQQESFLGSF